MGFVSNVQTVSRKAKYSLFERVAQPKAQDRILDMGSGGSYDGESFFEDSYPYLDQVTVLDLDVSGLEKLKQRFPKITACPGDACNLPFADRSFDIVFSNAVIEHVGGWEQQKKFADEVMRVSDRWYITTPNKWFPMELHYRLPLFQFVPKPIQKALCMRMPMGVYKKGYWQDINLLSARQMLKLFPGSKIAVQRLGGFVYTIIAYRL